MIALPTGGYLQERSNMSYPGILVKSNSNELQTSLKSSPELHSNKSLCWGSGYTLFHYYRHFIYIIVFHNDCTLVAPTLSTMNSLFSIVTLYFLQTSFVTCSPIYLSFIPYISISTLDLSCRYLSSNIELVLPLTLFSKSYSKNNSDPTSDLHSSKTLGQEPERGTAHKLKLMMSLVLWYGSICFYFCIFSISTLMLTYYDVWYQCNASHELHKPSWSLALNAWFFIKSLLLMMPLSGNA